MTAAQNNNVELGNVSGGLNISRGDTSQEQDVQFSDLKKSYFFAVSAFDNSQINHVYHDGAIELKFK